MRTRTRRAAQVAVAIGAAVAGTLTGGAADATPSFPLTSIPANAVTRGIAVLNALSPELDEVAVAQGAHRLENPTAEVPYYGYDGNGTMLPDPRLVQSPTQLVEA